MTNIYNYLDYRDFLLDFYQSSKDSRYMSYRLFGREIDTDASLLVKVFQKKRNLSKKVIPSIIKFCKLNNNEARFFELLFEFTKAKSQDEIKRLFDLMNEVKGVDNISLSLDQYSYYSKWYYSALWALMNVKPNQPASFYAKNLIPPISVSDAKEAIRVLAILNKSIFTPRGIGTNL
jgi:uncharacterized protein (TIGR02147 family)